MGRGRSLERAQYWRELIREQDASSLSISAFCRQHEVSQNSFFRWRRQLADTRRPRTKPMNDHAAKFVAIDLPRPNLDTRTSCCEVILTDGCRLRVPPQFDAESLRDILAALREVPC